MPKRYALGIDFGTESGRALLVDVETGLEIATCVHPYANGVLDETLPDGTRLEPDWALQDPNDWLAVLYSTIPDVLSQAGASPHDIIGIGVDFTSCTVLPVDVQGQPLCNQPHLQSRPHAWPKLWKHHAAQPEADRITEAILAQGDPLLERYGGEGRGIILAEVGGGFQFRTPAGNGDVIRRLTKARPARLASLLWRHWPSSPTVSRSPEPKSSTCAGLIRAGC